MTSRRTKKAPTPRKQFDAESARKLTRSYLPVLTRHALERVKSAAEDDGKTYTLIMVPAGLFIPFAEQLRALGFVVTPSARRGARFDREDEETSDKVARISWEVPA